MIKINKRLILTTISTILGFMILASTFPYIPEILFFVLCVVWGMVSWFIGLILSR